MTTTDTLFDPPDQPPRARCLNCHRWHTPNPRHPGYGPECWTRLVPPVRVPWRYQRPDQTGATLLMTEERTDPPAVVALAAADRALLVMNRLHAEMGEGRGLPFATVEAHCTVITAWTEISRAYTAIAQTGIGADA